MYGYAQPMQSYFTRDSVTPLDTSKELSLVVNPYDTKVTSLSYEIRTSDGSKVLENRKVKSLDKLDSYLATTIKISSDLLMNQEYSLQISLETNKGTAYYYTRVVSRSNVNASQYIKFDQLSGTGQFQNYSQLYRCGHQFHICPDQLGKFKPADIQKRNPGCEGYQ